MFAQLFSRHRNPHWAILLGLSAGLVLVVAVGTVVGLRKTDIHLSARVQDAAEIAGPRLSAHIDGRDAYLTGRGTEADLAHALALTAGIPGLRSVRSQVLIVAARTDLEVDPAAAEPSVTVVFDGDRITLRGLVADDGSHGSIVDAAAAVVGLEAVRDRLRETRAVKSAEWTQDVAPAIAALARFPQVTLAFGNGRVLVTGDIATEDLRSQVAAALKATGIEAVVESLSVTAPQQPWLIIERTATGITLSGLIGRGQLDSILGAFEATYGPGALARDELILATNSAEVGWPGTVAALIPSTSALEPWAIRADEQSISLVGLTSDPTAPARIAVVAGRFAHENLVTDIRLTPSAALARIDMIVEGIDWFEGPGDVLTTEATFALDDVALVMFAYPDVALTVGGHAARSRDIAADRENGRLRAASVRSYLVSRGLDPARVEAVGHPDPATIESEVPVPAISFALAGAGSDR